MLVSERTALMAVGHRCRPYLGVTYAEEEVLVIFGAVDALVGSILDGDDGARPGAQHRVPGAAPVRGDAGMDGGEGEQRASQEGFHKGSHLGDNSRGSSLLVGG